MEQYDYTTPQELNKALKKSTAIDNEWYDVRSIIGNYDAMFYFLIGAREAGKSYSVMKFCLNQWKKKHVPFTWIRLSSISTKKMLANNADKFVDADLRRQFDLDLHVKGMDVYDGDEKMAKILSLADMAKEKGVALYDKDYDGWYNIVCDEFIREPGEVKRFDISYNLVGTLENLVRSRKEKVRIFLICNLLEAANDVLVSLNFIPEKFGRYYLKRKRAVVDYIAPTQTYLKRRKGTIADILMPESSNFTNEITTDKALIYKGKLRKPQTIIKFSKNKSDWFTVWDSDILAPYKNEKKPVLPMRPYLDEFYSAEYPAMVFAKYDARAFKFVNLITQKKFQKQLELLKSRS